MKNQPPPNPEPPKPERPKPEPPQSCPVCFVAMQATDEGRHFIHRCEQCGTVIMVARPTDATEKKNPTMFF